VFGQRVKHEHRAVEFHRLKILLQELPAKKGRRLAVSCFAVLSSLAKVVTTTRTPGGRGAWCDADILVRIAGRQECLPHAAPPPRPFIDRFRETQ